MSAARYEPKNISELFDFVEGQLAKIEGVRRTQTYVLPYKIKEIDTWLPPSAIDVSGNGKQVSATAYVNRIAFDIIQAI